MGKIRRWLWYNLIYFRRPPWDTGVSPPELIELIGKLSPGRAIDMGCGTGTNLVTLGQAGWQVTGVDFAVKAVSAARKKLAAAGIDGEVRAGSVAQRNTVRASDGLPYDLVLDIGCYHGLSEESRAAYRQNLMEILAPGGIFLIYAHWKQDEAKQIGIDQHDFDAFCSLLKLKERQDSLDRWERKATWMRFER